MVALRLAERWHVPGHTTAPGIGDRGEPRV
jgi:hypothetical protein